MDIVSQLARLDDLIANHSANTAEMRNIIHSVLEQVQAYQQVATDMAALKKENAALVAENAALKPPPTPNWGSQPRIKGRMEP